MATITISRQFGAGGSSVAMLLARHLGAELVDSSLVAEVARRLELSEPVVKGTDEHPDTLADRMLESLRYLSPAPGLPWRPPHGGSTMEPHAAIVSVTEELIREAARLPNSVIVGRGGAFVLRDEPNTFHVFLHAAESIRLRTVMERFHIDEQEADTRIRETDANRSAYIRQHYKTDWRDTANYDLAINTGRVGFGRTADLILAAIGRRSFAAPDTP
jgi:cytidylate kinase